MITVFRAGLTAVLLGSAVGCRHASRPVTGEGSFTFVTPPVGPSRADEAGRTEPSPVSEGVMAAEPVPPLAAPVYPKAVLARRLGLVIVGVRITVNREGQVAAIGDSPVVFSSPNSHGAGFREAVEAAVRQWRFEPAVLQHMENVRGADGRPVLTITGVEKTDWTFDVAFTFTADGDVLGGMPERQGRRK